MINETEVNALIVPTYDSNALSDPGFLSDALHFLKINRSKTNLLQSRIVYEVKSKSLYQTWPGGGFNSLEEWGMAVLEKKRAMVYAISKVYEVFVVENNVDVDRLIKIDFSKLAVASAHTTKDNLEEVLRLCETLSLYDLQKTLRKWEVVQDAESQKPVRFVFEVSPLQADIVKEAVETAKSLVKSEIPGKIIEYICADFLCGAGLESPETHLERCVEALKVAFNVDIIVKPVESMPAFETQEEVV
jgi:hypothetical protein